MRTGLVFRFALALPMVIAIAAPAATAVATELPDPMRPPDFQTTDEPATQPKAPRPQLSLQSTLIATGRRSAVINGRSVRVGGTINGVRVLAIEATTVRMRDDRGRFTLRLPTLGSRTKVKTSE